MNDKTKIEWTDATWNPIKGCSRVSEGCRNCYAETVANRFSGEGQPYHGLIAKGGQWIGIDHQSSGTGPVWSSDAPLTTITTENRHALIVPHISTYYGEKRAGEVRAVSIDGLLGTQTTENRHAVVSAFLAKHYGGVVGIKADQALGTITTQDHHSLVTSHMVKLRGTNIGHKIDAPMHTITAGGTHLGEVRAFLIKYYGNEKDGEALDEPIHTIPTHDRFGLVTVHGEPYQIVDIGLRMLQPRELALGQGFPRTYILDPIFNGKPLTKTAQVRMIGNSVSPDAAEALVRANFKHEEIFRKDIAA